METVEREREREREMTYIFRNLSIRTFQLLPLSLGALHLFKVFLELSLHWHNLLFLHFPWKYIKKRIEIISNYCRNYAAPSEVKLTVGVVDKILSFYSLSFFTKFKRSSASCLVRRASSRWRVKEALALMSLLTFCSPDAMVLAFVRKKNSDASMDFHFSFSSRE